MLPKVTRASPVDGFGWCLENWNAPGKGPLEARPLDARIENNNMLDLEMSFAASSASWFRLSKLLNLFFKERRMLANRIRSKRLDPPVNRQPVVGITAKRRLLPAHTGEQLVLWLFFDFSSAMRQTTFRRWKCSLSGRYYLLFCRISAFAIANRMAEPSWWPSSAARTTRSAFQSAF